MKEIKLFHPLVLAAGFIFLVVFPEISRAQNEIIDCEDCPVMVIIPAGSFERRDTAGGDNYKVTFEKPFAIAKYELRVAEFRRFIEKTGYIPAPGCELFSTIGGRDFPEGGWMDPGYPLGEDNPVACVNISDAEAFAGWLSSQTGVTYRLPSEAEWEYAARAGHPNTIQWYRTAFMKAGDANCADCFGGDPMGREDLFTPFDVWGPENNFGVTGMLGNVAEWTSDCPGPSFVNAPSNGKARKDGNCEIRMARGGAFHNHWAQLGGNRVSYNLSIRRNDVGIRLLREL